MITSLSNEKVKYVRELATKARFRRKEGCYIAEGIKMFLEAPEDDIRKVYVSEHLYNVLHYEPDLPKNYRICQEKLDRLTFEIVLDPVFEKMAGTVTPQGILSLVRITRYSLEQLLEAEGKRLFVILENIQDPGNLGTILRTAEAAGVTGLIISSDSVSIHNPKVIRSTMGAIYRVPFVYTDDLPYVIGVLKDIGIQVYAATLSGNTKEYDAYDYRPETAFIIGNEGNGLSEETISRATAQIYIPMAGQGESLNASMAAGILMYEANRQRRKEGI